MQNPYLIKKCVLISALLSIYLSGCGGESGDSTTASPTDMASVKAVEMVKAASPAGSPTPTPAATPTPTPTPSKTAVTTPATTTTAAATTTTASTVTPGKSTTSTSTSSTTTTTVVNVPQISGAITTIGIENTGTAAQTNVPITFGQVFADGDLPSADSLVGTLSNGSTVPLQVNVKATHADGSVRHAIISAVLPSLPANTVLALGLTKTGSVASTTALAPSTLLGAGFSASVNINISGQTYTASVAPLLNQGNYTTWLSGPIVNEWLVSAPLVSSSGAVHPQLAARFAIRSYAGTNVTRVDVTVENDWAYQPAPQNYTYDVNVLVGGATVYSQSALTHYSHARWRKTFWWGATPQVNIRENTAYLIASKAIPNYDQTVTFTATELNAIATAWTGSITQPMGTGVAAPAMPMTGGRPDIGLAPGWVVTYLLTMDQRARNTALGTADLAGSWSVHYRDQNTGRPISIAQYPYMTVLGSASDTYDPTTHQSQAFPACTSCTNPNVADSAHAPAFNYIPYMLTGDYYQLEELQFWAMWDIFETNPGYRGYGLGLIHQENVRDQAWSLRNIADAAYITPDADVLKSQLVGFANNNINWYNTNYTNNPSANSLGVNVEEAMEYNNGLGLAPWMDDFFTSEIGHMHEQGFANTQPLLLYKAKFPVSRMTDPGFCWIFGGIYSLNVAATATGPLYTTIAQTYASSLAANYTSPSTLAASLAGMPCGGQAMATALGLSAGEMTGYSNGTEGYPSNLQPALAYSADSGYTNASKAWQIFMARSVKPDYSTGPQFAIVPR